MPRVVIIGGGISGLTTAYRLHQADPTLQLTLLEAKSRVGGNVQTEICEGYRVEWGPNGFLDNKPGMVELCRDLGLSSRMIAASEGARKNRFLFVHGQMHKLPSGPWGLLRTPLLSWRGKWMLFTEPFRTKRTSMEDESIADFVTRRAGREAAEIFADALVTGIHGGDPAQLSVAAAFPRLTEMERKHGSIIRGFIHAARQRRRDAKNQGLPPPPPQRMWSFREGLQAVVDALSDSLGPTILNTGVAVERIERRSDRWQIIAANRLWEADVVILSTPAYAQAGILQSLDQQLSRDLADIPYNTIVVVALGYREEDVPTKRDGFGYIAPQNTRRDVLGVQWCSSIFPDRAPSGMVLWRALLGGVHRREVIEWTDDQLREAVHREMQCTMGVRAEPRFVRIIRLPRAIPQYVRGHLDRVQRIETASANYPGLFLTGNAFRGIALNDCACEAQLVTKNVLQYLKHST